MKHFLFQIAATIQSWGNELAREDRPSDGHPRKSAALGLLGAAVGKLRADPWHMRLASAVGFAVAVLRSGVRMTDYHTVLTPTKKGPFETRRDQVEASDYTKETYRDYLGDFPYFVVALWQLSDGPGAEFEELARAVDNPVFELYAGRKSCSLSLPPAAFIVDVSTLREAFIAYRRRLFKPLLGSGERPCRVYWEDHPSSGLVGAGVRIRKDALVDRRRWLFRGRTENEGTIILPEEGDGDAVPHEDRH